jgi:hypothetical protein
MVRKIQNNTVSELALKYGSISIRTLGDFYGSFAPHCADNSKPSEVFAYLDVASFTQVIRDYKNGRLAQVCQHKRARPVRRETLTATVDRLASAEWREFVTWLFGSRVIKEPA